ncbi:hypothetical protein K435DRAFT_812945 [Dendrothele bispora CBS 962.96]|uniref:Uncharacterized protein n=1 Tax=Dendrothele bispora (strain CBS 962.96) TaxID=1314807 RepID=A0A4S8KMT1_DENBC|nr:hypothetical protein K435DRAFT_812945 [Dendrothele bispora CBS 962.96]
MAGIENVHVGYTILSFSTDVHKTKMLTRPKNLIFYSIIFQLYSNKTRISLAVEQIIQCNEAGIIFCQDLVDLHKVLELHKPQKDIVHFVLNMEKKLGDTQQDILKAEDAIARIQERITKLLAEITSRDLKQKSKWKRVFASVPFQEVQTAFIIMGISIILSSICNKALGYKSFSVPNDQDHYQLEFVLQQVIPHLEAVSHWQAQVLDWSRLRGCLYATKHDLLENGAAGIAAEELSAIIQMGDMCKTFVFELKKIQFEHASRRR